MMSSEQVTSSSVASETPRVDKRQPIIIQNVDHVVTGRTRCKRKALAVANLYLSAVMLSRQGVSPKGAKEHQHSKVDEKLHDVAETDPGRYRGFGPSSSLTGASPAMSPAQPGEKVKLKKQVTFIEGPHDPDISNTKSASYKTELRSIFSNWNEQVPRSKDDVDFVRHRRAEGKASAISLNLSSASKEQSEFFSPARDLCRSEDLNSSFPGHSISDVETSKDYTATRSLDTIQHKYHSINDLRGRSTATHRIHFSALGGNEPDDITLQGNGYQSSIDIDFNTHKTHPDNENKAAAETNLSSNQNKKTEIESALQLNPSHSLDNKRSELKSENTILRIDTAVKTLKKMHLDPDTNNTRNVIKVHFLKDETLSIPRVQSSSYRQNLVSTNNDNPVNDDTLFLQNSSADNVLANSELNSLVKENTQFLMQKYSFLGERKPKQESQLASFDQHSEGHLHLKPSDYGNKEAESSADVNIPQRIREKSDRKQTTNSSEYELLMQRARSCSAVERRSYSQTSCGLYRANDRFFVLTDPSTSTRTARNRLLEEFVMDNTRSRHQLAVQKRLKSACQST